MLFGEDAIPRFLSLTANSSRARGSIGCGSKSGEDRSEGWGRNLSGDPIDYRYADKHALVDEKSEDPMKGNHKS